MKPHTLFALTVITAATAAITLAGTAQAMGSTCQSQSAPQPPTIVELYTSEGCSSCPPADQWLSTLKGKPGVLPLAFHVTYWDSLGWPDRYAMPEATARQRELAQAAGSRQVYTPQVVVNGRDWRVWPQLPDGAAAAAQPVVTLARDGDKVTAQVAASAGAKRLAGYWAVLEDGHQSQVRAGENAGATLKHDHVVRLYQPVAAWAGSEGRSAQLSVSRGVVEHPRRVVFVVTDAASGRPLQAATLAC